MLESKIVSHRGTVRDLNEDCVAEDPGMGFWIVADGVGGNGCGDVASQLAVQTVERKLRQGQSVRAAVKAANQVVADSAQENAEMAHMATTIVV